MVRGGALVLLPPVQGKLSSYVDREYVISQLSFCLPSPSSSSATGLLGYAGSASYKPDNITERVNRLAVHTPLCVVCCVARQPSYVFISRFHFHDII